MPVDGAEEEMRVRLALLVQQVFLGPKPPACTGFLPVGTCSAAALTATVGRLIAEQSDRTVCAIDLDPTAPRLHRSFDMPCSPGVLDRHVVGGSLLKAAREVQPQLWVIPGGRVTPGQATVPRVSASELDALRDAFDILVMTLEPHTGATAPSLGTANAVILVLDADTTRRDTARSVTDMLRRSGTSVLGAVLVNRRYPIPDAVYGRL
jgi:MinD-like ATPase involved in chromosome partitioning or flagellar assembly